MSFNVGDIVRLNEDDQNNPDFLFEVTVVRIEEQHSGMSIKVIKTPNFAAWCKVGDNLANEWQKDYKLLKKAYKGHPYTNIFRND